MVDCHDDDDDEQAGKQWLAVHQGAWNAQTHCMRSSIIRQVMTNINIIVVIIYHILIITLYPLAIGRALGILQGCQPGWAGFQLNVKTKRKKETYFPCTKNVGYISFLHCVYGGQLRIPWSGLFVSSEWRQQRPRLWPTLVIYFKTWCYCSWPMINMVAMIFRKKYVNIWWWWWWYSRWGWLV